MKVLPLNRVERHQARAACRQLGCDPTAVERQDAAAKFMQAAMDAAAEAARARPG
jgi:hypothetical protein